MSDVLLAQIPSGLLSRLVIRARIDFSNECRYIEPGLSDTEVLERWLASRPARPAHFHTVEPRRAKDLGPAGAPPPPSPLIQAADELRILAGAIRRTVEVAERPDLGVDDRLTAFAEGIETARLIVLEVAERG